MPSGSKRTEQIGERIRELIAMMLVRGEIADPRVKNVTINSVKVSSDLQQAKVYYSVFGEKAQQLAVQKGLTAAAGFIRNSVGKSLDIRYTPAIFFYYDDSIENAAHINEVLGRIKREDAANAKENVTVDDSHETDE